MSNQTKLICFDLDDTIIDDNFKFETTFCDCLKAVLLGLATKSPEIDEIIATVREIDNQLLQELPKFKKYTPHRLIEAWHRAYKTISESKEIPVKKHILDMLEAYIWQNFEPPYMVIAGAVDALIHIRQMPNLRMEVLTIGDQDIQNRKINFSRLNHYFDHVEVVFHGDDKYQYLKEKADEFGAGNVIMVGNSIRSDINPALTAGVHAIYIPRGGWSQHKQEPVSQNYIEVRRIFELPVVVEKILTA